jgi:hypothetical protein
VPLGFKTADAFKIFEKTFMEGFSNAGYDSMNAAFQGSSVVGFKQSNKFRDKAKTILSRSAGTIFDSGKPSDFDIAIASPELFAKALEADGGKGQISFGGKSDGVLVDARNRQLLQELGLVDVHCTNPLVETMHFQCKALAATHRPS